MAEPGGIAAAQLRAIVERIERLEEEKKALSEDIRDVYAEAKANGFDTKTIRTVVRLRNAQVAGGGKHALIAASLIGVAHGDSGGRREYDLGDPIGTVQAGGGNQALVAAFLAQHSAGSHPGQPAKDMLDPVPTITSRGTQQGLAAVTLGNMRGTNVAGRAANEPLATISAGGSHAHLILAFLQRYYGQGGQDQDVADPLTALTGKARHGLVTVMVRGEPHYIDDIGMRMLEPEEGAAAHGFPPGALPGEIEIGGKRRRLTKTEKYHLVGNSVPPRMVQLLAELNVRPLFAEAAE